MLGLLPLAGLHRAFSRVSTTHLHVYTGEGSNQQADRLTYRCACIQGGHTAGSRSLESRGLFTRSTDAQTRCAEEGAAHKPARGARVHEGQEAGWPALRAARGWVRHAGQSRARAAQWTAGAALWRNCARWQMQVLAVAEVCAVAQPSALAATLAALVWAALLGLVS